MRAIIRRLEAGQRCWGAECALRGCGVALLGICATGFWSLHRSIHQPGAQGSSMLDFALAAFVVAALGLGLALTFEGPALFRLIPLPGQHLDFLP